VTELLWLFGGAIVTTMVSIAASQIYRAASRSWHRRRCAQTETSRIARTAAGMARIEGEVLARETVRLPFSTCVAVYHETELLTPHYSSVSRELRAFLVRDESGEALIQIDGIDHLELVAGAEIRPLTSHQQLRELRERDPAIAEEERKHEPGWLREPTAQQRRILPGDRVTVWRRGSRPRRAAAPPIVSHRTDW
jgi:hypothetical protein